MYSSWFRLSFIINNEQIELNLNSAFANKYDKIQFWLQNFDNFWEISNSSISLLRIVIYNRSIQKKLSAFGFWFRLLQQSSKLPSILLRFQSIWSVKQIQIKSTICCYVVLNVIDLFFINKLFCRMLLCLIAERFLFL
jgi:hypothetical protein